MRADDDWYYYATIALHFLANAPTPLPLVFGEKAAPPFNQTEVTVIAPLGREFDPGPIILTGEDDLDLSRYRCGFQDGCAMAGKPNPSTYNQWMVPQVLVPGWQRLLQLENCPLTGGQRISELKDKFLTKGEDQNHYNCQKDVHNTPAFHRNLLCDVTNLSRLYPIVVVWVKGW